MYPDRLHPYSPFLSTYNHSQEVCRFFNNQKTFAVPLNTRVQTKVLLLLLTAHGCSPLAFVSQHSYGIFAIPIYFKIPLFVTLLKPINQKCLLFFSYIPINLMLYIKGLYLLDDYSIFYIFIDLFYLYFLNDAGMLFIFIVIDANQKQISLISLKSLHIILFLDLCNCSCDISLPL